jgi:hypothetical protein
MYEQTRNYIPTSVFLCMADCFSAKNCNSKTVVLKQSNHVKNAMAFYCRLWHFGTQFKLRSRLRHGRTQLLQDKTNHAAFDLEFSARK